MATPRTHAIRHHAGRFLRRGRRGGGRRHRAYRARHDIAGSIRYPAYACGVHGLRPTVGVSRRSMHRCRNARSSSISRCLAARAYIVTSGLRWPRCPARPARSPGGCRRPGRPGNAEAGCAVSPPDGLETAAEVKAAVADAASVWKRAGWVVEEIETTPPLREPADLQTNCGSAMAMKPNWPPPNAKAIPARWPACAAPAKVFPFDADALSRALIRRATLTARMARVFEKYPVLLMPVSGELPVSRPFRPQGRCLFRPVWRAQLTQIAIPFMGLPGLTVSTGLVGRIPVGVQVVSGRYREDLCLLAGEAIEAGGTPSMPVDPVR